MITARELRNQIGGMGFEYSVRRWKDGEIWVCPYPGSQSRKQQLVARLETLGYKTQCNGKPGTGGEYIIEVTT